MNKQDKVQANNLLDKISDFFWVYFDEKTAKMIKRHPDRAIPLIKEAITNDKMGKAKIAAYGEALVASVDYQAMVNAPPPTRVAR